MQGRKVHHNFSDLGKCFLGDKMSMGGGATNFFF